MWHNTRMLSAYPVYLKLLVGLAAALGAATFCAACGPRITRVWMSSSVVGRTTFFFFVFVASLTGGSKHLGTNAPAASRHVLRTLRTEAGRSVSPEDVARGWCVCDIRTNAAVSYAMPDGMSLQTNWWVRGAYEDVCRVGLAKPGFPLGVSAVTSLWAYAWGMARPRLGDPSVGLVPVGGPMSAIPGVSRFWTGASAEGGFSLTWENFAAGRMTGGDCAPSERPLLSAQIELLANGDFFLRSNEVETVCRRIDPEDWDGDGWPNVADARPYDWDGLNLPLAQALPPNAQEDAYYWIDIVTAWNGLVEFSGDGPSDLPDPRFESRAGEPSRVKLLIGKSYSVTCACEIAVVARSDQSVEIRRDGSRSFSARWPVSVFSGLARTASGAPGARGQGEIAMHVWPDWLCGEFLWATNGCCRVEEGGGDRFFCVAGCGCQGCRMSGAYVYEGYALNYSGISCGCRYEPDPSTSWSLSVPPAVFRGGALRALEIDFSHGSLAEPEEGTLRLVRTEGRSRVRMWEDAARTAEATRLEWNVQGFSGATFYLEGVETSESTGDVGFSLVWERPGGSRAELTGVTTCAEVSWVDVDSGVPDSSPNPPPFEGQSPHPFDVTHSPSPDCHWSTHFGNVANDDQTVRDFDVNVALEVWPHDAPVGRATWFALPPTPEAATLVRTGSRTCALRNPKEGGVYRIGAVFPGSPTNECVVVLPLAGAEMKEILRGDLAKADAFARMARSYMPRRWYARALWGACWFCRDDYGYYRGRPDNAASRAVWYYSQIDAAGKGCVATLDGHTVYVEKLSNLIAGYACVKLCVPVEEQLVAQLYGTVNDRSANESWRTGMRIAGGADFDDEIADFAASAWNRADGKWSRVWPNPAPADNHRATSGHGDFDREFSSPGFLYVEADEMWGRFL